VRARRAALAGFDWSSVKMPLLLVHHEDDGCLARRFPLVKVSGGNPAQSGPCEPLSQHGFFGREAQAVDAMAAWMLGRPFAKDIR
jgi:hypothetical protein